MSPVLSDTPAVKLEPSSSKTDPVNGRGLESLFTDHAYCEILEQVIDHLDLRDIARLLRVTKLVNEVFTSSSKLQLSYRRYYHALPESTSITAIQRGSTCFTDKRSTSQQPHSAKTLSDLLEKEERLDVLKPSSIRCIHVPNATVFELKSGLLLMGECLHKIPTRPSNPQGGFKFDAWSIWLLDDKTVNCKTPSSLMKDRGGVRNQGFCKWRVDYGDTWDFISMCPEDNVLAIAKEHQEVPCGYLTSNSTALTSRRIHFYQLIPPAGTPTPPKGAFQGATRHPEAALSFIEVRVPAKYHLHQVKIQLAPGGKMGVMLHAPATDVKFSFLGFWDWKKGVSLGAVTPTPHILKADDFRFFGPFVIVSVFREIGYRDELSKEKGESRDDNRRSTATIRKIAKGYKVRGRTSRAGPRGSPHDSEDEEMSDSDLHKDNLACIETYELLKPSNGKEPSPFAHRAYTDRGYNPSEPCTWDYQDIPTCAAIASFFTPPLNSTTQDIGPLSMMLPGLRQGLVTPNTCDLGEVFIDDALLKGERDGVMTFTIVANTYDEFGNQVNTKCQGTINLREIVHRITIILTDRIRPENWDRRSHAIQTDLETMWSDDPAVYQSLQRQLGLDQSVVEGEVDDVGWESDPEEAGRISISLAALQLTSGKSKSRGRGKGKTSSTYKTKSGKTLP
ncbi:uncharacterized protein IL334_003540 [Kwoniella shivajii]|uniref:F-box domain-containing protein n=1 Tax=Kwoniella shivajii TaxID=564305 RepID=A0ABZ1CXU9_9TREE|nr:hypothetical protein IL334_003540 [Kwoniella shivajii]